MYKRNTNDPSARPQTSWNIIYGHQTFSVRSSILILNTRSWLPDHLYTRSLLPNLGYQIWRPDPGYRILDTRSWLPDLGYQIWIPDPGYQILDTRSRLPDLGFHILATRPWLPDPDRQILGARSWTPDPGCQMLDSQMLDARSSLEPFGDQ